MSSGGGGEGGASSAIDGSCTAMVGGEPVVVAGLFNCATLFVLWLCAEDSADAPAVEGGSERTVGFPGVVMIFLCCFALKNGALSGKQQHKFVAHYGNNMTHQNATE